MRLALDLRDGTPVLVRPIRPEDRDLLVEGFTALSPRSRFLRFHTGMATLSERQITRLTDVDQDRHVAYGALDVGEGPGRPCGVARYVRLPEEPTVAEAAVTVVDAYQGRGLGTLLLVVLSHHAIGAGVTSFRNYVLGENAAMLRLFDELGARRAVEEPGLFRVDLDLPGSTEDLPDTPAARAFGAVSRQLAEPLDPSFPPVFGRRGRAPSRDRAGGERGMLRTWLDAVLPLSGTNADEPPADG